MKNTRGLKVSECGYAAKRVAREQGAGLMLLILYGQHVLSFALGKKHRSLSLLCQKDLRFKLLRRQVFSGVFVVFFSLVLSIMRSSRGMRERKEQSDCNRALMKAQRSFLISA